MAHGDDVRRKVRAGYVFDQLDLSLAAIKEGVPEATARRWKREAKAAGDDWDRARSAQLLAGGGVEEVVRQTLAALVQQGQALIETIQADNEIRTGEKVQMLASLADSYNKLIAASKRMMPETDKLAVGMDVLKRLAEFTRARHPQHANALLAVLEPFGDELAKAYD